MQFLKAAQNRSLKAGIIGLGYVGIPLALRLSEEGFQVLGFDINQDRVDGLNRGESSIQHIPSKSVKTMQETGFEATTDMSRIGEADAILICVPTPLNSYREPDLSFVLQTAKTIAPHLRQGQLISLESTTWPGTTEEMLRPIFEARGFETGKDYYLVYSPEREDPGNKKFTTRTIPKIVGGVTPACLEAGMALYGAIVDQPVAISSTQAAELTKLLENIHRAVNIGLVNELKIVADAMGIDIVEVIDAAATKPFGFTAYYPGPGLGGHCIPIDPFYLTWKAREFGLHTRFIELAGEINAAMPQYVVQKLVQALNKEGKPLSGSSILVLGVAYKPDVDDMRESPSVEIMELLRDWGAVISYSDPHVPVFPPMRRHHFGLRSTPLTAQNIASFDAVMLLTHHEAFDYEAVAEHSKLIIDTRGVFKKRGLKVQGRIISA